MANSHAPHPAVVPNALSSVSLQRACGEDVLSLHKRTGGDRASRVHALWHSHGHRRLQGLTRFLSLLPAERGRIKEPCPAGKAYPPASVACLFRVNTPSHWASSEIAEQITISANKMNGEES